MATQATSRYAPGKHNPLKAEKKTPDKIGILKGARFTILKNHHPSLRTYLARQSDVCLNTFNKKNNNIVITGSFPGTAKEVTIFTQIFSSEMVHDDVFGSKVLKYLIKQAPDNPFTPDLTEVMSDDFRERTVAITNSSPKLSLLLRKPIKLSASLGLLQELLEVLCFLKKHNILHRNISPDTLSFSDSKFKITGFEYARSHLTPTEKRPIGSKSKVDFSCYQHPNTILGVMHSFEADLWSVGCIFYEIVTGKKLFNAKSEEELLEQHQALLGPIEGYEGAEPLTSSDAFKGTFRNLYGNDITLYSKMIGIVKEMVSYTPTTSEELLERLTQGV